MTKQDSNSSLNRREFLRIANVFGRVAALAAFLEACSKVGLDQEMPLSPTDTWEATTPTHEAEPTITSVPEEIKPTDTEAAATEAPTEAVESNIARLALVKTKDRAEGVRKAIDLLGISSLWGKRIFLKPNFNSSDPAPGSTHPDTLISLVEVLKDMGAEKITVGDRSGMGNTRQVMQEIGVFEMAKALDFEVVVFDELEPDDWILIQPSGSHWSEGFAFARPCLEADALVQTCCLKTHRYGGHFTMSLKNSVGMVAKRSPQYDHDFMEELHASPDQRRMIAEINMAYTPALVVLDGIEAFISGGPDKGEKVSPEVILAGTDRVAIDATGVALLRYFGCQTEAGEGKLFQQEQIARAVDLGLGIDSPEKIEFLTGDSESAAFSEIIKEVLLVG